MLISKNSTQQILFIPMQFHAILCYEYVMNMYSYVIPCNPFYTIYTLGDGIVCEMWCEKFTGVGQIGYEMYI